MAAAMHRCSHQEESKQTWQRDGKKCSDHCCSAAPLALFSSPSLLYLIHPLCHCPLPSPSRLCFQSCFACWSASLHTIAKDMVGCGAMGEENTRSEYCTCIYFSVQCANAVQVLHLLKMSTHLFVIINHLSSSRPYLFLVRRSHSRHNLQSHCHVNGVSNIFSKGSLAF